MGTIKIKQVKSTIGKTKKQKDTIKALGFRKLNHELTLNNTPQIQGMIAKVAHLIEFVES